MSPWLSQDDFREARDICTDSTHVSLPHEDKTARGVFGEDVEMHGAAPSETQIQALISTYDAGLKTEVNDTVVSWTGDCVFVKYVDNTLSGLAVINQEASAPLCLLPLHGKLVESYRDCTRDSQWKVVLLCIGPAKAHGSKNNEEFQSPIWILAGCQGGDAMALQAPVQLNDEEKVALTPLINRLQMDHSVGFSFSCSILTGGVDAFDTISNPQCGAFVEGLRKRSHNKFANVNFGTCTLHLGR